MVGLQFSYSYSRDRRCNSEKGQKLGMIRSKFTVLKDAS